MEVREGTTHGDVAELFLFHFVYLRVRGRVRGGQEVMRG